MRTRSFAAAAASLALVLEGLFAAPAFATTTTVTAATQPIVAWSESTTGSITLVPNYTANAVTNPSGIGSIVSATGSATYMGNAANGGLSCTASFAQSGNFINYGVVFSPITGKTSACDYQNAMLAIVTTNDTNGWTLTQQLQIAPSDGFALCAVFPQVQVVKTLPLTTSSFTGTSAAINETTCSGTGQEVLGSGSNTPGVNTLIPNPNATGTTTGTFYQGEDVLLLVTAQVVPTSYSVTMNVTLTLN
jgi:hypothetical protein